MNFLKKIHEKKFDNSVHMQFQKFSKGEFRDRAVIKAKNSRGKYIINTSSEFANELVREMAEKLGSGKTNITGVIVSTMDLKGKINYKEIKQFQGVKKYILDGEMSGDEIIKLINDMPKNFFALSFEVGENKLKIKPKAPKSGKPGKGDENPKADFCKIITNDREIGEGFVFEKPSYREAEINHTFLIESIVIPESLKKEKDFAKIREESKRQGRIIRNAMIDGKKVVSELEFEA